MAKYQRRSKKQSREIHSRGLLTSNRSGMPEIGGVEDGDVRAQVVLTLEDALRQRMGFLAQAALQEELSAFLAREAAAAGKNGRSFYRNGYHGERAITTGIGPVPVEVPRLREIAYESQLVPKYKRSTPRVAATLCDAYLHGLALGDFNACFSTMFGSANGLSPASIVRLKASWEQEYKQWCKRPLHKRYLYVWVDGVYPKIGPADERVAVLTVIGLRASGHKEVLAIEEGYREDAEAWSRVFRSLKRRGVRYIGLIIGDGIGGLWKAVRDVFPEAAQQRCWIHKIRNVKSAVPDKMKDEVHEALTDMYNAKTLAEGKILRGEFVKHYEKRYPKAVASLLEPGDRLWAYTAFPKAHWDSIRSTNVIESPFNTVKIRTDAARRIPNAANGLHLVFKLLTHQEQRFHRIHGYKIVRQELDKRFPITQPEYDER
jgi:putative transposase